MRWSIVTLLFASSLLGACAAAQASASKDPMKCERDPNCKNHQNAFDCSTQCADDPGCLQRCTEVQQQTGTSSAH